jgi:hypothetical protein
MDADTAVIHPEGNTTAITNPKGLPDCFRNRRLALNRDGADFLNDGHGGLLRKVNNVRDFPYFFKALS